MNVLFTYAKNQVPATVLYNLPAVNDSRELAPTDWRIPDYDDVLSLINAFGGEALAGGSLKSVEEWKAPNQGATNSSHFNALPAGRRTELGEFVEALINTTFWFKNS